MFFNVYNGGYVLGQSLFSSQFRVDLVIRFVDMSFDIVEHFKANPFGLRRKIRITESQVFGLAIGLDSF